MITTIRVTNKKTKEEEELFCVKATNYLPVIGDRLVCFAGVAKVSDRILHYDKAGDLTILLDVEIERTTDERVEKWKKLIG